MQSKANQRVPADIANFVALDDLMVRQAIAAERLEKLASLEESKVPTGLKPLKYSLTDQTKNITLRPPWIAFVITNDATTDGVYYSINSEHELLSAVLLKAGETKDIDMKYSVIESLHLVAESGGTADIRIWGIEGSAY